MNPLAEAGCGASVTNPPHMQRAMHEKRLA